MPSTRRFDEETRAFADDVRRGLSARPRWLSPRYFYDALGSQLFEAICQLPWYPITRSETRLLSRQARAVVAAFGALELCELGGGSGEKLAILAAAIEGRDVPVRLVDISEKALELSRSTLSRLSHVRVTTHCATYEEGLHAIAAAPREGARLVCFLGSNIGNFDPRRPARCSPRSAPRSAPGTACSSARTSSAPRPSCSSPTTTRSA